VLRRGRADRILVQDMRGHRGRELRQSGCGHPLPDRVEGESGAGEGRGHRARRAEQISDIGNPSWSRVEPRRPGIAFAKIVGNDGGSMVNVRAVLSEFSWRLTAMTTAEERSQPVRWCPRSSGGRSRG
jgi:hypothetical protein